MTALHLYLIGAAASVLLSAILVRLLRGSLVDLLEELWSSRARAAYWAAAGAVSMLLLGVWAGTGTSRYGSEGELAADRGFFALAGQLRGTLLGLFIALGCVSLAVLVFMAGADRAAREAARLRGGEPHGQLP